MMPAPVAAGERVVLAREVLLASCGRFLLNPEMRERLVRAAGEATSADWSEVVEKALHIGGGGLLHHHLTAAGVAPPSELREAYRWIATLNADWEEEHRRIWEALREVDVPVLLIKGAALQERVYQDAGLRYMEDADWVLREETGRAAAIRVLGTLGYRQADSAFPNIWEREDFLIDLHTSFLSDDRIRARTRSARESERGGEAEAGIWERARPSTVGESFFVPAPEDHMLILCNHLMKHSFEPGPWFSDLEALLAAEPGFDWGTTLERARAWGVLRSLAYAFWALGALEDGAGGVLRLHSSSRKDTKNFDRGSPNSARPHAALNCGQRGEADGRKNGMGERSAGGESSLPLERGRASGEVWPLVGGCLSAR